MNLRPIKFMVQVHLLEEDDAGNIIGERASDQYTVYGLNGFKEFALDFERQLKQAIDAQSNSDTSTE
jgi:hypothetical protein